jgi:hypothetical protein
VPIVLGETPEPAVTEQVTERGQPAPQRRTTRLTAGVPPKRFDEETYGKFGGKASAATQNERWEGDIFETGLCFASASLRIKAFNVPLPTSYKGAMASEYATQHSGWKR